MSASDHIGMQFKISPAQQKALETWLTDYNSEELGFTHNYETSAPTISVHNLGRAALNVGHAADLTEIANEEYKQRGAAATVRGLFKVSDKISDQHALSQAAGVMVGGRWKELWQE
jgi:hypothetical protein